jgi:hypothetical protein
MAFKEGKGGDFVLELWCSWLSRLLYTQKVLGSNPSSSTFYAQKLLNLAYSLPTPRRAPHSFKRQGSLLNLIIC